MRRLVWVIFGMILASGLGGCASTEVAPPPAPAALQKQPTYYYVAAVELNLKEAPDPAARDRNVVRLNEKVEELASAKGWFQVSAADGRSGWASSKYFSVRPVTSLYVAKKGACLRAAPNDQGKPVCKLQVNDLVKIRDPQPQNWVEVTVERTRSTGWVEVKNLSKEPMVIAKRSPRRRGPAKTAKKGEAGAQKENVASEGPLAPVAPVAPEAPEAPEAGSPAPATPEAL